MLFLDFRNARWSKKNRAVFMSEYLQNRKRRLRLSTKKNM